MISTQTYSQELSQLVKQLKDTREELDKLLLEKADNQHVDITELQKQFEEKSHEQQNIYDEMNNQQQKQYDDQLMQHNEQLKQQEEKYKQLEEQLKFHAETKNQYEETNKQFEEKVNQHNDITNKLVEEKNLLMEQNIQYEEKNKQYQEQSEQFKEKLSTQQTEFDEKINEKTMEITNLLSTIETNEQNELKKIADLQAINENLEKENTQLQQEIEQQVQFIYNNTDRL